MKFETATIWHKINNTTYVKTVCYRSFICLVKKANVSGTDMTADNSLTVRCFTYSKFPVSPGDRICCNLILSKDPPADAFIIKEIKENFNSSARLRHYRFECV